MESFIYDTLKTLPITQILQGAASQAAHEPGPCRQGTASAPVPGLKLFCIAIPAAQRQPADTCIPVSVAQIRLPAEQWAAQQLCEARAGGVPRGWTAHRGGPPSGQWRQHGQAPTEQGPLAEPVHPEQRICAHTGQPLTISSILPALAVP